MAVCQLYPRDSIHTLLVTNVDEYVLALVLGIACFLWLIQIWQWDHECIFDLKKYFTWPCIYYILSHRGFWISQPWNPASQSQGPLLQLKKFNVSCIKWCMMHVINLGILMSLNGGALILGSTMTPWNFAMALYPKGWSFASHLTPARWAVTWVHSLYKLSICQYITYWLNKDCAW